MLTKTVTRTLIVALSFLGLGTYAFASSTLNFPRISYDSGTFTGMAFVNPNTTQANITLRAYGPSGALIPQTSGFRNPVTLTVPAGQQKARNLSDPDMFGTLPANQVAWVQATCNLDGITGFFLFLNGTITALDGADLPELGRKIVFHEIRDDGDATTEVNIINPGTTPTLLSMALFRPGVDPVSPTAPTLNGHGVLRFSPREFFGVESIPAGSYVTVTAEANVGGFEFVRIPGQDLLGMNAVPSGDAQQILYFPQMAVGGGMSTNLGLVNYSNEAVIATISVFTEDGKLYTGSELKGTNPSARGIGPNGALYLDVGDLFEFTGDNLVVGWLKVEATSASLNGFVSYGFAQNGSIGGSLAAVTSQAAALTNGLFSHIATVGGFYTGVALLNPGQIANPYRVAAFGTDGTLIGTFDGVLRPGQRVSELIHNLVPAATDLGGGFILVRSTQPIYMTSLFGTVDLHVLSNIPPQPAPASFVPDAAQPKLQVSPPLAVVQPGAESQFSLSGASGATTWKVNDQAGGNSTVGTISTSGKYKAPAVIPDPLPVTISAEIARTDASPLSGGATVDVLTKETLVSGTGQVLSVAYLRGLNRLYTAELAGASISQASSRAPEAAGDSEIYETGSSTPRHRLLTYSGQIAKILGFQVTTNTQTGTVKDYLLILDKSNGKVLRYDPAAAGSSPAEVISGLDQPNSMVLDPSTGDLLIAEASFISSHPRSLLTSGITSLRVSQPTRDVPRQIAGNLTSPPQGISVDACTGRIFVALGNGQVVQIDRFTGAQTTIAYVEVAGKMLGLYRKEIPCPAAFQVLVADFSSIQLINPSAAQSSSIIWQSDLTTRALAYLPTGNDFTGSAGILIGDQLEGGGNEVSLVRTPGLYTDQQANVGAPILGDSYSDPQGDTFGIGTPQLDITHVRVDRSGETPDFFTIELEFTEPIRLAGSTGSGNEVYGFIDFDTDQNESTGASSYVEYYSPYTANLGVDYVLSLFGDGEFQQALSLFRYDPQIGEMDWETPVAEVFPVIQGNTMILVFDLYNLATVSDFDNFNFAVVVGPHDEPTDAAPNGGHLMSGLAGSN